MISAYVPVNYEPLWGRQERSQVNVQHEVKYSEEKPLLENSGVSAENAALLSATVEQEWTEMPL